MSYLRLFLALGAVATLASVSRPAVAQDEGNDEGGGWFDEEPEPEPTPAPEEAAPSEPAPNVVATDPAPDPAAHPQPAAKPDVPAPRPPVPRERPGRFRWGLSPFFGAVEYDDEPDFLFMMGLEARFGGQLSDDLAVYATPSILGSDALRVGTGVIFEGCFGDVFTIGGGADVALGSTDGWKDFVPGGGPQARVGLHIGKDKPTRRKAFSMYGVTKIDFYTNDDRAVIVGGMLGYDGM